MAQATDDEIIPVLTVSEHLLLEVGTALHEGLEGLKIERDRCINMGQIDMAEYYEDRIRCTEDLLDRLKTLLKTEEGATDGQEATDSNDRR